MKKLALLSVATFAFAFALTASAASDVVLNFSVSQDADVLNTSTVTANSGGNTQDAEQDLNGGTITTGDAEAASSIENHLNNTHQEVDVQNASDVTVDSDVDQDADATNTSNVDSDSGNNDQEAEQDINGGNITTGTVTSVASIMNGGGTSGFFNRVFAKFNIGDADPDCGCESVTSDVAVDHDVDQDAEVLNDTDVEGDSGSNTQDAEQDLGGCNDCGDGSGADINTGGVQVGSDVQNNVNNSETHGDIGAGSDITVNVADDQETDGDELMNLSNVDGDSGNNAQEALQDLSGGTTNTGKVTSVDSIFNRLNQVFRQFFIK